MVDGLDNDVIEQAERKLRMRMHNGDWKYYHPSMSGYDPKKKMLRLQFDNSGIKPKAPTVDFREQ